MDDSNFIERWSAIRGKGFFSYLITRTILWQIVIVLGNLILNYFLDFFTLNQILSINFSTLIGGMFCIIGKWRYNEREYKKVMGIS